MTDDISKVVGQAFHNVLADPEVKWRETGAQPFIERVSTEAATLLHRIESATTPAEVGEVEVLAERLERLSHHHRVRDIEFGQSATDCVSAANTIRTLARQLAEAKVDTAKWKSLSDAAQIGINVQHKREVRLQSQLAEATRRLGDVEGLLREIRGDYEAGLGVTRESYDTFCRFGAHGTLPNDTWPLHFERRKEQIDSALTKEPAK